MEWNQEGDLDGGNKARGWTKRELISNWEGWAENKKLDEKHTKKFWESNNHLHREESQTSCANSIKLWGFSLRAHEQTQEFKEKNQYYSRFTKPMVFRAWIKMLEGSQ